MGSEFLNSKQFQRALEENPEQITWSSLREVVLQRGNTGKLGFKFHTFQGGVQNYTVVTKVKEDCQIWKGKLKLFDRIISINNFDISHQTESRILKLLTGSTGPYVKLTVCQPDRVQTVSSCGSITGSAKSSKASLGSLYLPSSSLRDNSLELSGDKVRLIDSVDGKKSESGERPNTVDVRNCAINAYDNNNFTDYENLGIRDELNNVILQERLDQLQLYSRNIQNDIKGNWKYDQESNRSSSLDVKSELNDLSRKDVRDTQVENKFRTNFSELGPNITRLNSNTSENTCSSNQSSGSWSNSEVSWPVRPNTSSELTGAIRSNTDLSGAIRSNSDSYGAIRTNTELHVSGTVSGTVRSNNELYGAIRLNRESSGTVRSNSGTRSNSESSGGLRSNSSRSSKHSGGSLNKMGKSKGDKIVRKFYKGNSQDSNDGAEELEPLRPVDGPRQGKAGKADSRYSHNMYEDDRALSVPLAKEVALSVQDIMIVDDPSQATAVATQPTFVNNCPCATCAVTTSYCQSCGNKPGSNILRSPSQMVSLVPDSMEGLLPENYGPFLLKNPHLALWDGAKTRVVEIERGTSSEFPFTYKVKIGKNQDASVEIYTLVESLAKSSQACGKLNIGDWIRSVNGTPIQLPMDAFSLLSNNNKDKTLRLVIQRPIGFSQQAGTSSSPPCSRSDKGDKSPQDLAPKSPQELTPTSPLPSPHLSLNSHELREPLLNDTHLPGHCIEVKTISGNIDKKEPRKIYIQNINKEENESDSWNTPFPKVVKLPKVRMFICGSEAEMCANLILQGSEVNCDISSLRQGYAYVDCSMATNSYGSVVISPPCSNLYATSLGQSNMYMPSVNQSDCQKEDNRCKHCGNEYHCSASHSFVGTVANVELFVVSDDKFFHQCCSYLFTKYSIFLLTFDGAKLLRSATAEISRMQCLSHTIRSFAGYDCHVMSCGLLQGGMADEVRTLFYTSSVNMLQIFNVLGPELIDIDFNLASSDSLSGSRQIQSTVWKVVTETIQRQHILQPCLLIMDHLNSIRERELLLTEGQLMEIVRQKLPQYQQDVHQMVVTEMSMCGEIVSGKAAPITLSHLQKIENLVLIEPKVMVNQLHSVILAIVEDRQRWAKVHSYGLIDRQDMLTLIGDSEAGTRHIAEFMESYGLLFRYFSGHSQSFEYFLPYFAVVSSSAENVSSDRKDHVLYLQFKSHGSSQLFFYLLFNIASHTDSPKSFSVQTVNSCQFKYHGMTCFSVHHKLEDRIMFMFKREDKSKSVKLPDLYSWLLSVCQRTLGEDVIQFMLGAACPLGESCHTSSLPSIHIINLEENKPQFCGDTRIDLLKPLKAWKNKTQEFMLGAACPLGENCHTSSSPSIHIINLEESKPQFCGDTRIDLLKPLKAWKNKTEDVEKVSNRVTKASPLMHLKFSVLHRLYVRLKVPSELGRDWKGLAGLMGLTVDEVALYSTANNPPQELLTDWSRKYNGTVGDLLKLLAEMEREDIISEIKEALAPPTPTVTVQEERNPSDIQYTHAGYSGASARI